MVVVVEEEEVLMFVEQLSCQQEWVDKCCNLRCYLFKCYPYTSSSCSVFSSFFCFFSSFYSCCCCCGFLFCICFFLGSFIIVRCFDFVFAFFSLILCNIPCSHSHKHTYHIRAHIYVPTGVCRDR